MRVIHVITRLVVGGAQENTVATVLGLRGRSNLDIDLVSGPTTGREGSMESRFHNAPGLLTLVPTLVRPVHPVKDVLALNHLTRIFRERRPDIVHTHSGKAGVLGRLAARKAGVPVIIHHIHGPSFGPFQGALANWIFTTAERRAAKVTTHFVCSANAMSRLYLAAGIGRPEMYTRIFSGFVMEPFLHAENDPQLRTRLGFASDDFVIGKIARLASLKGHDDLLAATRALLPDLPRARLLFVGDGAERARIESAARNLGLGDKVVFTGLLPPDEVPRYVGVMDCLAHLSTREALSRALPQALAAGKPVVSYDFDGADEVCLDGRTGFLVRTGDVAQVTRRLRELATDANLRRQLGEAGRNLVRESFRVERMLDDLYTLYVKLARAHGISVP
jgi:glycosyltransferase involved in cell wall biosynthesis